MSEREIARNAARRLAIIRHAQEVTGNMSKTCRYYGITRQVYYKWLRRYEEGGLEALRDCSSRPHVSPNATKTEVVGEPAAQFSGHRMAGMRDPVGNTSWIATHIEDISDEEMAHRARERADQG